MSNQTFTVAGLSVTEKGVTKARFGNDLIGRIKKLKSNTGVNFVALPSPMTRIQAAAWMLEQGLPKTPEEREAVARVAYRGVTSARPRKPAVTVVSAIPTQTEEAPVINEPS